MEGKIHPIDPPDDELLRRIRSRDAAAFTVVYRRCQGPIYRFTLHMSGSRTLAEDVTQETFMALFADKFGFDGSRGSLDGYLVGVARNCLLRRLEKERPFVPFPSEPSNKQEQDATQNGNGHMHASLTVMPADLVREETIDRVRQAVLRLPTDYREVVVLCDLQEMKYEEAGKVLGCAIGTVRSRLHRARALLMDRLRDMGRPQEQLRAGEAAGSRGMS